MATIYMDGFDHYGQGSAVGSQNMISGAWAEVSGDSAMGPRIPTWGTRTGLLSLANLNNGFGSFRYVMPTARGRVFVSFGYACGGLPLADNLNSAISFCTSSNVVIAKLIIQSNGSIALRSGSGTILASSAGPIITSQSWQLFEMDFNQAAGSFILRIDDPTGAGTPIINATGLSLGSSSVGQIRVLDSDVGFGATTGWMDDLFLRDATGSVNNGFLGDRRVATLVADADGPDQGWSVNRYTKLGTGILNAVTASNGNQPFITTFGATSLNIGSSDFTLETFVRFHSLPTASNKATIFSRWSPNDDNRSYELFLGSQSLNGSSLCWQTSTDGTNSTVAQPIVFPWTPDLDIWHHVAICRSSGQLLLFVDGQQQGLPITDTSTYFAAGSPFSLMGESWTGAPFFQFNGGLDGWADEFRFTNGISRYTANFTPTTVEFPRGSPADPNWSNVSMLCGFDSQIQDESGFARVITAAQGAAQQTTNDGVFAFPVVGKQVPDDNTFITAPFIAATGTLTVTVNPSATNTVTVGTKDGTVAAVYTFKTAVTTAFDVKIGANIQASLQNLFNAINAGTGAGTVYGTGTTANFDVTAIQLPAGQMGVYANIPGTSGNTIATTKSGLTGSWAHTTLTGGVNIPGPSSFGVETLPPHVTIISAVQVDIRASKSDAGLGSIQASFVGPLGSSTTGGVHALTVNPIYYSDVFEVDPDTSGPISPTTIRGGLISINRTS